MLRRLCPRSKRPFGKSAAESDVKFTPQDIHRNAGYFSQMNDLATTARALVAPGKGIRAADESTPTIVKRFQAIEFPCTEESRRAYREMLLTAPGLGDDISGVILFDETIRQKTKDGTPLVEILRQQGIVPGIKVGRGAKPLARFPGEKPRAGHRRSHSRRLARKG